ncbi:18337_t:CDS:2 [Rhizophagus irregularis]|nr:18337_t:CDS:2 [Rhizophagus irregularis]
MSLSTSFLREDIRVVVSIGMLIIFESEIDFGTTYSGYGYAHRINPNDISVENKWIGHVGYKTPTIIKYEDDDNTIVQCWGSFALPRMRNTDQRKPMQLFKLYLLEEPSMELPNLPNNNYKGIIIDYLKELGEKIKDDINGTWEVDFNSQVLIVLTAKLIQFEDSKNLIFITEPEAAAIHCLNFVDEVRNLNREESFMVVDCGGGTVDLTCHEILANDRIGEITESKGGNYGSSFVDKKFIEFLSRKLGKPTIELLDKEYHNSLQYMVQEFCEHVKLPFTGQKTNFRNYEIDLEDYRLKHPLTLKDIIKEGNEKKLLEKADWIITLVFEDVKGMFDPFITKIISLIGDQLNQLRNKNKECSAMMLVGGFSESKYLQDRIKNEFNSIVPKISVPSLPVIAVIKGGVKFGLDVESVVKRVLKRTYGDPPSEMLPNGYTVVFEAIASRGKEILANDKVIKEFRLSSSTQRSVNFNIYVTKDPEAKFCNDPGVSLLRQILATAKNKKTGENYRINQKPGVRIRI